MWEYSSIVIINPLNPGNLYFPDLDPGLLAHFRTFVNMTIIDKKITQMIEIMHLVMWKYNNWITGD